MKKIIFNDLSYGRHERNIFDLIIPENAKVTDGLILIIHGGGWVSCDKSAHADDLTFWSDQGYIVASINYRYVSEEIHIPDLLDDITGALTAIKARIAEYGYNTDKLLLMGGSAGAHLCMMYALTRKDEAPICPVMIMDNCGPVDFTQPDFLIGINGEFEDWKYKVLSDCCGIKITKENRNEKEVLEVMKKYSPINYITKNSVPIISAHGKADNIVPFNQCENLHEMLEKNNIIHEMISFENYGHDFDRYDEPKRKMRELCSKYADKFLRGE